MPGEGPAGPLKNLAAGPPWHCLAALPPTAMSLGMVLASQLPGVGQKTLKIRASFKIASQYLFKNVKITKAIDRSGSKWVQKT